MVGQELSFIPGTYGILFNIWPEKEHWLLWGFPVGRSILGVFMGLVGRQHCCGGAVGWPWSHSTAEACWSISPLLFRGFPAPPYQSPKHVLFFKGCTSKAQNPA